MGNYVSTDNTIIVTKENTNVKSNETTVTDGNVQPIAIDEDIVLVTKEENNYIECECEHGCERGCDNGITQHKKFVSRVSVFLNKKVKPKFKEFKEKMSRRKYARNVSPDVAQKIAERTEDKNTYRVFTINSVKKSDDKYCVHFDMEGDIKITLKKYSGKYDDATYDYKLVKQVNPLFFRNQYYQRVKKIINMQSVDKSVMKSGFVSGLEEYNCYKDDGTICDTYLAFPIFDKRFYVVYDCTASLFLYNASNYTFMNFPYESNGKYALFNDGTILSLDENCSHDLKFGTEIHSHLFIEIFLGEFMSEIETQNNMKIENTHDENDNENDNANDGEIEKSFQIHSDEENDEKNDEEKITESNVLDDYVEISKP